VKSLFVAAVAALALCASCSPKLSDADIAVVLSDNVPQPLKSLVTVEQVQSDISASGEGSLVKFKSQLKLKEPLFEAVDFETAAKAAGGDASLFRQIEESARGLAPADRESLAAAIQKATVKPVFIVQTAPVGTTADWYGSFSDKRVIDKWVSSDYKTDVAPLLKGQPRSTFGDSAVESTNAKVWFDDARTQQADLLQKMDTAKKLAQKDAEIDQAKTSAAAEVSQARAIAGAEREARETMAANHEKQARQMPVELSTRRALVGGTSVLVMQAAQAMTVRLEVVRGLQRFARDYQLVPGRPTQVGHVEGWGFLAGDAVRLSNPSFDPKVVTVP
jgi:hypothetical protein